MTYLATFFSHFGAVRCQRTCRALGRPARMMPVPRALSSSCGTCVQWQGAPELPEDVLADVEQIVEITTQGYRPIYRAGSL